MNLFEQTQAAPRTSESALHSELINVQLGERSYAIEIGSGLLNSADLAGAVRGKQVLVVTNETLAPLFLNAVMQRLQGKRAHSLVLPDGEAHKSLTQASLIFERLSEMQASRDVTLIALGGGVIGDLTGFAAALWMRGVPFVQIPTSLLAMVDSSVGGKTAVNLASGKNLVGAFWQPSAVFIDVAALATLPQRQLSAGLSEVVKYGAIADPQFFAWLEANASALLARDADALQFAIARSCAHKAGVVARDERELGERALLNFGHTFGHALEAASHYRGVLHGEAIAMGMVRAARLSTLLGVAPACDAERLRTLLANLYLPVALNSRADTQDFAPSELLELMRLDKKALSGVLRLILWRGIGQAFIGSASDAQIIDAWSAA